MLKRCCNLVTQKRIAVARPGSEADAIAGSTEIGYTNLHMATDDNLLNRRTFLATTAAFGLAGCSSLPTGAPTSSELLANSENPASQVNYQIFDLTEDVVRVAGAPVNDTFTGRFAGRGSPSSAVVGAGDILSVSIFESALGGLFTAPETSLGSGSKSVVLPQIVVDSAGYIRIPFAESIRAAGRTPREIEKAIEARLKGKAIDPQVIVTLGTNRSSLVTVSGDVRAPSRFPIGIANERLLDVISQAGGSSSPPHETLVKVVRGDHSATVNLKTIFDNPRENIYVRPGDTILLQKSPRLIIVLGAASRNAELRFDTDRMTLATAMGQAGGLMDSRADPTGVFVFRYERQDIIRRLRPGWSDPHYGDRVPTIYKLDLRVAGGYFLAQSFQMRHQDLLFVTNADGAQLLKMFQLIGTALGTTSSAAAIATKVP